MPPGLIRDEPAANHGALVRPIGHGGAPVRPLEALAAAPRAPGTRLGWFAGSRWHHDAAHPPFALAWAFCIAFAIAWLGHDAELHWRVKQAPTPAVPAKAARLARPIPPAPAGEAHELAASDRNDDTSGDLPGNVSNANLPPAAEVSGFLEQPEAAVLQSLRHEPVQRIRKGSGGRTLAFKLELADGTKGYFKPEQTVSSAHWYAEVAAYYLDRALGLGRVPPLVSRRLNWEPLRRVAEGDRRLGEIKVAEDGSVRGAFVHWLPKRLVPVSTPAGWESWVRIKPFARWAVSPYQASETYVTALAQAHARIAHAQPGQAFYAEVPMPERAELPAELSDLIVFDFLTLNFDRWGGNNTNVLSLGNGGPLIFLDNGDGFSVGPARRGLLDARLAPVQRFRKRTIDAVKALDVRALGERLAHDPLGPILDARMLEGLELRRRALLEHASQQARLFGEAVYAW